MSRRNQWLGLLGLLAVWAGLLVWQVLTPEEPRRAPLTYVSGQGGHAQTIRGKPLGLKINLDLLAAHQRQAEKPLVAPKNIFVPLKEERTRMAGSAPATVAKASPPPASSPDKPPAGAETLGVPAPPPGPPPPPPGPTPEELAKQAGRQELAQFRYLGYLSRGGREEAFLSKGKDLHIVRAGETIEQRVLVKAVAPTGVTLQETVSQVEHTVQLTPDGK